MLGDERRERRDVARVVDRRHERAAVGVVQRRRELVQVGGERGRAGAPERRDDVDALARAGEEDDAARGGRRTRRLDSAACAQCSRAPPSSPARPARTASTSSAGCSTDGWTVHAAVRDLDAAEAIFGGHERLGRVRRDIRDPGPLRALVGDVRPEELYNLAGESSVGASFADPQATWESNAHVVVHLLDAIRLDSPETRFYQASSGEMFGSVPGESVVHDEYAPLNPQSPYAAAKAAAHMLCRSYRESLRHPDRLRDPLQPRVAAARAAVPLAEGRRPRPGAAGRHGGRARSRSGT